MVAGPFYFSLIMFKITVYGITANSGRFDRKTIDWPLRIHGGTGELSITCAHTAGNKAGEWPTGVTPFMSVVGHRANEYPLPKRALSRDVLLPGSGVEPASLTRKATPRPPHL
jgi:hypothetical protein